MLEEDIEIFKIYRNFIYTGKVYSITDTDQDGPDDGRAQIHSDAEWTRLAHCYLLTVKIRDERFGNACIDAIIEKMIEIDRYPTGIASEVYPFTSTGDKLRKLIVDVHVWKGMGNWVRLPHDDANGPIVFMQDVIAGLAKAGGRIYGDSEMPWDGGVC